MGWFFCSRVKPLMQRRISQTATTSISRKPMRASARTAAIRL
jgi:hypothetical protein